MLCLNCKRELPDGVKFCSYCGFAVTGVRTGQAPVEEGWNRAAGAHRPNWLQRLIASFKQSWERITQGIELQDLWAQFRAEARESYSLYSKEVDWESVKSGPRWRGHIKAGSALFWAVIMKLSPSRRILLLVALALFILALIGMFPAGWILAFIALLLLIVLELADRVIMKRDLEIAREIQGWLVPKQPPEIPGLEVAFATRPANTVAGDYYDAFLRPVVNGEEGPLTTVEAGHEQRLFLVVADVAGKSVPAALLMATLQASLRTLAAAPVALPELVVRLNEYACAHSLGGLRFTTAFFAELEPATLRLTYINAGHNPPILRRASAEIARLEAGGLPLGIRSGAPYAPGVVELGRGDLLVILTDGVVEAENEHGVEYGEGRLLELLKAYTGGSAAAELRHLMSSLDAFVGLARQHDDITCLLLRTE